jgi:uncharacterized protein YutD
MKNPEQLFAVINNRDYVLGTYTSELEAIRQANIFTTNNRAAGDLNSIHRVIEYIPKNSA